STIADAARDDPEGAARIAIVTPPSHRVLTWIDSVPGYGWSVITPGDASVAPVEVRGDDGSPTVDNGLVTVSVDGTSGTFSLGGIPGFGRLVDDGDSGDTYNYSPP